MAGCSSPLSQKAKKEMKMAKKQRPTAEDEAVAQNVAPPQDLLIRIRDKAKEAQGMAAEIANAQAFLAKMNTDYYRITTIDLPELMASAGMEDFTLKDGTEINVKDFVSGSLPKEPKLRKKALDWIVKVGAGGLIKEEISMAFGRGSREDAERVKKALEKLKVEFSSEEGIHPQTLFAFARERFRKGEKVPTEMLGLTTGRVAKFKLPNSKEKK